MRFFTGDGRYALLTAILLTALYAAGALSRVVRNACREEMDKTYLFTCPRLVLCPAAAICLLALWFHVLFDSRAQKDEGTIYD